MKAKITETITQSKMTNTIEFCPGLLDKLLDNDYLSCQRAAYKFMENPYAHGLNLEKLAYHQNLYSIRANNTIRIILTPIRHHQRQQWIGVDILTDHNYPRLNRKAYNLESQDLIYCNEIITDEEVIDTDSLPLLVTSERIEYHSNQFILLDDTQQNIKSASLPLIISGAPGAGKTCMATALMINHARQHGNPDNKIRVLYLTQSSRLCHHVETDLEKNLLLNRKLKKGCDFFCRTPEQLYHEYQQSISSSSSSSPNSQYYPSVLADPKEECKDWLQTSYWKKKTTDAKHLLTIKQFEDIYQEFRSISGYTNFEDYNNAVGNRHTLFKEEALRQAIYTIYIAYQKHLKDNHVVNILFTPIMVNEPYDFVVVDEAQDNSRIQQRSICNSNSVTKNNAVAMLVGDHQGVFGSESVVPFIESVFWSISQNLEKPIKVHHERLLSSYRCPKQITDFANAVLTMKYHTIGGSIALNKDELLYVTSNINIDTLGAVKWLDNTALLPFLSSKQNDAQLAVIAPCHLVNKAKTLFGAHRVFTPPQIKGMEYNTILWYCPFEGEAGEAAHKAIQSDFVIDTSFSKKPAANESGNIKYSVFFNQLFVAATRARANLLIYQPENHTINKIRAPLYHFATHLASDHIVTPVVSSNDEWLKRKNELDAYGLHEQAQAIADSIQPKPAPKPDVPMSLPVNKTPNKKTPQPKKSTSSSSSSSQLGKRSKTTRPDTPKLSNECLLFRKDFLKAKNKKAVCLLKTFLAKPTAYFDLFEQQAIFDKDLTLFEYLIKNNIKTFFLSLIALIEDYQPNEVPEHIITLLKHRLTITRKAGTITISLTDILLKELNEPSEKYDSSYNVFMNILFNQLFWGEANISYLANHLKDMLGAASRYNDVNTLDKLYEYFIPQIVNYAEIKPDLIARIAQQAIQFGHVNVLKSLTKWQIDINAIYDKASGYNLATQAIKYDQIDMLDVLIELGADLDKSNKKPSGFTAAHFAVCSKSGNAIKKLLELNVGFNLKKGALSCAMASVIYGGHVKYLRMMVESGMNLEKTYEDGSTLLLYALWCGQADVVNFLIRNAKYPLVNSFSSSTVNAMYLAENKKNPYQLLKTAYYSLYEIASMLNVSDKIKILLHNSGLDCQIFQSQLFNMPALPLSQECLDFKANIQDLNKYQAAQALKNFLLEPLNCKSLLDNAHASDERISLFEWLFFERRTILCLSLMTLLNNYSSKEIPEYIVLFFMTVKEIIYNNKMIEVSIFQTLINEFAISSDYYHGEYKIFKEKILHRLLLEANTATLEFYSHDIAIAASRYNDITLLDDIYKRIGHFNKETKNVIDAHVIFLAIQFGNVEVLRYLVKWDIDFNAIYSSDGYNLATRALQYNQIKMLDVLVELGVDINAENKNPAHLTAIAFAESQNNSAALKRLNALKSLQDAKSQPVLSVASSSSHGFFSASSESLDPSSKSEGYSESATPGV